MALRRYFKQDTLLNEAYIPIFLFNNYSNVSIYTFKMDRFFNQDLTTIVDNSSAISQKRVEPIQFYRIVNYIVVTMIINVCACH